MVDLAVEILCACSQVEYLEQMIQHSQGKNSCSNSNLVFTKHTEKLTAK